MIYRKHSRLPNYLLKQVLGVKEEGCQISQFLNQQEAGELLLLRQTILEVAAVQAERQVRAVLRMI
jgi:hypothetical protein